MEKQDPEILKQEEKREIRRAMKLRRREADADWICAASRRIQDALAALPEFEKAAALGCYQSLPFEVQTGSLIGRAFEQGKRVCCPAYNEAESRYELTWLSGPDAMVPGRWSIPEPDGAPRAGFMDVDLLIVPALAFDRQGNRLGHGGGHFDRILGIWSGVKIGIAFDFQVLEHVPMGCQDIPVDVVVTEQAVYRAEGVERY